MKQELECNYCTSCEIRQKFTTDSIIKAKFTKQFILKFIQMSDDN